MEPKKPPVTLARKATNDDLYIEEFDSNGKKTIKGHEEDLLEKEKKTNKKQFVIFRYYQIYIL